MRPGPILVGVLRGTTGVWGQEGLHGDHSHVEEGACPRVPGPLLCVCVCVCARAHPTPVCPGGPAPAWTLPPVGSALTWCLGLPVPRPLGGGSSVCVSCFPLSEGSHACNLGPPPHPVPSSGHLPRATSRGPASQAGFSVFIFKQPLLRVPAHGTSWGSLQHWGCGTGMMMLTMFP